MKLQRFGLKRALIGVSALVCLTLNVGAAIAETPLWLTGVNLSDGALNPGRTKLHFEYTYPSRAELEYFAGKGFSVVRVSVLSERILPPDDRRSDWGLVADIGTRAAALKSFVILDLHQFGTMPSGLVGRDSKATAEFVAFWREAAKRLRDRPNVIFGLMNEPHEQTAAEWLAAANEAIGAIRGAGARQLILVPGSYWDGAFTWTTSDNAAVMAGVRDSLDNYAFELHQYLDHDSSGTSPDVIAGSGASRLAAFTDWARPRHVRGFLGEFGFAATPAAMKEGEDLVAYMKQNADVWRGWTYWAAGQWWGDYMFSVEPGNDGRDKPQMAVLERWK